MAVSCTFDNVLNEISSFVSDIFERPSSSAFLSDLHAELELRGVGRRFQHLGNRLGMGPRHRDRLGAASVVHGDAYLVTDRRNLNFHTHAPFNPRIDGADSRIL